ncbi:MAG: hypothetical protein ACOVSI_01245, partial [Gemmatimonas sp.]
NAAASIEEPLTEPVDDDERVAKAARVFPCAQCGASLTFEPGISRLVCSACRAVNEPPAVTDAERAGALQELDYLSQLRQQASAEPELGRQLVECPQCGARTELGDHVVADRCAFCATSLVSVAAHEGRQIRPRGVVPFAVDQSRAQETFRQWIAGRWFAPNALKRTVTNLERVRGVYLPCWTFDARTTSHYVGQRGVDRQVQDTSTDSTGKTVVVTRTVTDWYPASGVVTLTFDDTLVLASHSLPDKLESVLADWDIAALVPFASDYLAGFTTEAYQVGLEPAFEEAKAQFGAGIIAAVHQDIGGNHQRVHDVSTRYDDVTFKHILLPAWICSYRFGGKSWCVVVNGQTGAVRGDRPWSIVKLTLAALVVLAIVAVLVVLKQRQ